MTNQQHEDEQYDYQDERGGEYEEERVVPASGGGGKGSGDFPSAPEHFLLRIHCAADLHGGWISLKGESSLLVIHLLNFLLLEHIIKKRHVNLIGLDHSEIRLERHPEFERTGVLKETTNGTGGPAGGFEQIDEEMPGQ